MNNISEIKEYAAILRLVHMKSEMEDFLHKAEQEEMSYSEFLKYIFKDEIDYRQNKAKNKRIKEAGFPYMKKLNDFDLDFCEAISPRAFKQLSELNWLDGIYNLILSGPPGVGKTHLAIALGYKACEEGYHVSYASMQYLMQVLRTAEIDRRSRIKLNRILKSNLLIIDEVGYLPISANEGNMFFQLISELQEQTSIIITTNKGFEEWSEFLNDPALATAILDRLSYHCDRIDFYGKSYRLENRKSFLEK